MVKVSRQTAALGGVLAALAFAFLATPVAVSSQEQAAMELTDERMTLFARVHMVVVEAREEFNQAIAVTHDDPGKAELRTEMDEKLTGIYQNNGMTQEEYELITLEISRDETHRETFERILTELAEGTD